MSFAIGTGEITLGFLATGNSTYKVATMGFADSTIPTEANAESIKTSVATNFYSRLSSQYSIAKVAIRWQQEAGIQRYVETTSTPDLFNGAATPLPSNCAIIIQKKTAFGGKKNRGRMYVPGLPEGLVDQHGNISSSELASLNVVADSIFTGFNAVFDDLVIHHHYPPSVGPPLAGQVDPSQTPTVVTSLEIPVRIGTQRRRMSVRSFPLG